MVDKNQWEENRLRFFHRFPSPYLIGDDLSDSYPLFFHEKSGRYNLLFEREEKNVFLYEEDGNFLDEKIFSSIDEEVDLVYFYGLGLGYQYESLQKWLETKEGRYLIFIEDDKKELSSFLYSPIAEKILKDPKVHIAYLPDVKDERGLSYLTEMFPALHVEVMAHRLKKEADSKLISDLELTIYRKTTLHHALFSDRLNAHMHFENFLHALLELPDSFLVNKWKDCFKGMPALVCGAGPSLLKNFNIFSELENRALILAGGSSITALSAHGIHPHLGVAIDPNEEEYLRIKSSASFETPILFATRIQRDVFSLINGSKGYIRSGIGGMVELWMEEELGIQGEIIAKDIDPESLSVTMINLALAKFFGCNPIVLHGIDLAYTDNKRYPKRVLSHENIDMESLKSEKRAQLRPYSKKNGSDTEEITNVQWLMEADAISSFVEKFSDRDFFYIDSAKCGSEKVTPISLEQLLKKHAHRQYDIKGLIHTLSLSTRFSTFSKRDVMKRLETLFLSLKNCKTLLSDIEKEIERIEKEWEKPWERDSKKEMIDKEKYSSKKRKISSGKMALYEVELEEEIAFSSLLYDLPELLGRFSTERDRRGDLTFEKKKNRVLIRIVDHYLSKMERFIKENG